ncbi:hypothetical protein P3T27_005999 [Kitasatospora sp. MAA19]|nr:hypothetical protein [Kitasatospora sp. MAA19]
MSLPAGQSTPADGKVIPPSARTATRSSNASAAARRWSAVARPLAQLGQREVEQATATATATATSVYALMGADPLPPRLRTLLGDFHRGLITLAPTSAVTREWTDRVHAQGGTQ